MTGWFAAAGAPPALHPTALACRCRDPASQEIAKSLYMLFGGIDLDPSGAPPSSPARPLYLRIY